MSGPADLANCVIRIPARDSYSTEGATLMGRQSANEGFLRAWFQHTGFPEYWCMARFRSEAEVFARVGHQARAGTTDEKPVCRWIRQSDIHRVTDIGTAYLPGPQVADMAWVRRRNPRAAASDFSLVGMTHTTCELGIQDSLADMLTAPVYPWDAQICPSHSVQTMVKRLLDDESAWLREHVGATRLEWPQLPVLPIGVDTRRFQPEPQERARLRSHWRERWNLRADDVCVLYMGRIDLRTKANLFPTLDALELAAQRLNSQSGPQLVLALVGWFASEWDEAVLRDAVGALHPGLRVILEDGRSPDARLGVWQAADIFTSLVDNIQETFGLTPIEAMAAGLPVVVSDYDGYRESVREGIDGFRIPTLHPPMGSGRYLMELHSDQAIGYRDFVGRASALIGIDISAAAAAFTRLALDAQQRAAMGAAGARRARDDYEWSRLIPRLQQLFTELQALRLGRSSDLVQSPNRANASTDPPRRGDPFYTFSHYPSEQLTPDIRLLPGPLLPADAAGQRAALARQINRPVYEALKAELPLAVIARVLSRISAQPQGMTLAQLINNDPELRATMPRYAGWLVKTGLLRVGHASPPSTL
jgi:glycosyltransferase involved in cell wall biosynthesis